MKKTISKIILLFLFLTTPLFAFAQMFSVNEQGNKGVNTLSPYLRAGVQMVDFEYKGDPSALGQTGSLSFTGPAAQIAYESGGLGFALSLGNEITNLDDRSYFSLSLNFNNPFYLISKENFGVGIPVKLETKIATVRSDAVNEEFSQTNLSAGAGLIIKMIVPEKIGFTTQFIPNIGFSTASGGFVGGNVFSLTGKARIDFYELVFGKNISLGYDYIFDSYNIDGEEFDYDFTGHTITLGISL